jgi:hypothetical protein
VLHQAAFATGGIVLVDDTLLGSLIQGADRCAGSLLGARRITFCNAQAGFLDERARAANERAITDAAFFILPIALDLRLNISQLVPPKKSFLQFHGFEFYFGVADLSSMDF